jgi:hypothetical protein
MCFESQEAMSLLILLSNMFSLMLDGEADLFLGSNGSDAFFGKKKVDDARDLSHFMVSVC